MSEPLAEAINAKVERFRQEMQAITEAVARSAVEPSADLASLHETVARYTTAAHQAQDAERRLYREVHGVIQARARLLRHHQQREQGQTHERTMDQSY